MSLLDISRVTQSLINLLFENIRGSSAWSGLPDPDVNPLPPDLLEAENALGVYLYHLSEDASVKNAVWPNRLPSPARFSPMGLNLHYVISPHSNLPPPTGTLREQLLMGLAVKTLHDYATVDKNVFIKGVKVLHSDLDGDRVRVTMRSLAPHEAVTYWTAGQKPLRLSAYYECSVVLMDPEEPASGSGRVLMFGIQTFVTGEPRLTTSRSTIAFQLPTEPTPRSFEAQPAQVAPTQEVAFLGTELVGDRVALLIRADRWSDPIEVDAPWAVTSTADRIFARVQTTVPGQDVIPGTYSAYAKVTKRFTLPDGSTRDIDRRSNATPFQVTPLVVVPPPPYVGGIVSLTGNTFQHADIAPQAVRLFVGGIALERRDSPPSPPPPDPPGTFRVVSATQIDVRFPAGLTSGAKVALRVIVNDSENSPAWIEVP